MSVRGAECGVRSRRGDSRIAPTGWWIVWALSLAGCAGPQVTALDVEIARAQAEAQRACYAAHMPPDYPDARDAALLLMARALTGDPCRATNVYDARAKIAEAQNQAVGRIVPGVVSGAVAVAGVVAGADVLKTGLRNSGGAITGNNNTVYDTRSNVSSSRQGEGASLSVPTNGPDMSAPVTNYHLPEATP